MQFSILHVEILPDAQLAVGRLVHLENLLYPESVYSHDWI
jgi:hypothetical protein